MKPAANINTHLAVVKESSRNHGTIILYTLDDLSADTSTRTISHFYMCTYVCLCNKTKLTFMDFTLAGNINSESLINLNTELFRCSGTVGTKWQSSKHEIKQWHQQYLVKVLQLDGVEESRRVDCNVTDTQTWKTNSSLTHWHFFFTFGLMFENQNQH